MRLFVMQVEGSEPTDNGFVNPLAAFSMSKSTAPRKIDGAVELRKQKLTHYFESIDGSKADFYVHAYDPWDWPMS